MQPGQLISQDLKEADSSDDMAIQAEIANVLVDSSYLNKYKDITFSSGTELLGSVEEVFEDLMTPGHIALPHSPLSPAALKELADLESWLAANKPNYEMYRDRFWDAVEAFEFEAHSQYPSGAKLARLRQKRDDAAKDWNIFGRKQLFENKYGRYAYLSGEDPTGFWARVSQDFASHKRVAPKGSTYYQTFLVPSVSSWNTAGWASFERRISESDSYSYSKSTSWNAGISIGWGLWSVGGGAGGSSSYSHHQSSSSTVDLKFEYLRVRIFRPWMRSDILSQRFWTWKKAFGGGALSDGGNLGVVPPVRPLGRMPVLPQYLVLVKNLELSGAFSSQEQTEWKKHVTGGASVGWGPFSLSGSYSESSGSKYTHASFDGVTFKLSQPQIIARTGLLLPRCPNPDLTLPWQDDAWIPGQTLFEDQERREVDARRLGQEASEIELELDSERIAEAWRVQRIR